MNKLPEDLTPMGKIIKPHGVIGELKVFLYNSESETLKRDISIWFHDNNSYCSYKIISMNEHLVPYGELDLIVEKNGEIIFVEVKTISKKQLGTPELKVDDQKKSKLKISIDLYIMKNEINLDIRLDVISVMLCSGDPKIKHYKGIDIS